MNPTILKTYRRELILLGLLVALLVIVGIRQPSFLSLKNLDSVWHDSALLMVLALVQMPIVMSRGIDLSVAANLALSGMLVSLLGRTHPELPFMLLLLVGIGIGLVLGTVNSVLITWLELPPIVATLGTMSIYRGTIYPVSGGQWITASELPQTMLGFPNARWLGLTSLEWISLVALLLAWLLIHQSRFGREVRALGGNPGASRYVGIPEKQRLFALYAISGAVAGMVGVLWVSRYSLASTELAMGFELQVVAACVLGGVSIAGGVGGIGGVTLAVLLLGMIGFGMGLLNVPGIVGSIVIGSLLVLTIALPPLIKKLSKQSSR